MLGHHLQRDVAALGIGRELAQLDCEAFAQVARRDSGRLEVVDLPEHRLDLVDIDLATRVVDAVADVIERQPEVTVLVDGVDDRGSDDLIGRAESRHGQLPMEPVLERLGLLTVGDDVGVAEAVACVPAGRGS